MNTMGSLFEGSVENQYSDKNIYKSKNKVFQTEGVVGLYNLGNTCYMNSLLQCLKNLPPLTNFILTKKFNGGKLINEYQKLLFNLISNKNEIVDAFEYHKALGVIDSYFKSHEQRDSSKLFLTTLKALMDDSKDYNEMTISKDIEKADPKLYKRYINSKERNPSLLYDLFFGFLKNICYCEECYKKDQKIKNFRYQPYSIIDLNLTDSKGKRITDLEKLIENYEMPKYSNFECSCGAKLIERNLLGRIPPILVFKFQRSIDNKHINHLITYPSVLYMKKYSDGFLNNELNKKNPDLKFNLTGVMLHYGSANFGHKTSYSKNFIDDNWYYFNDTSKYFESESSVLNDKEAFMLFYVSDSHKFSKEKIKKIISLAEKNVTKNNYYSERYVYLLNKPNRDSNQTDFFFQNNDDNDINRESESKIFDDVNIINNYNQRNEIGIITNNYNNINDNNNKNACQDNIRISKTNGRFKSTEKYMVRKNNH